jgi:2-C-methyl-D-erythritol 4-phosphate cytidylyltransferase
MGGKRNNARRRVRNKRTFVQRHQVIAVISALGSVDGEHPGALAGLRLGSHTLLEMVVDRVAKCAGGIVVVIAAEGVDAAKKVLGAKASVCAGRLFDLDTILAGIAPSEAPVVLVHDLAFPFAGPPLMTKVSLAALDHGAGICVGPALAAIGEVSDGFVLPPVSGAHLQSIAMPQAFLRESLQHLRTETGNGDIPSEQLWKGLQLQGEGVSAVPNPRFNIRIGTSLDWLTARKVIWPWLQARNKPAQQGGDAPRRA